MSHILLHHRENIALLSWKVSDEGPWRLSQTSRVFLGLSGVVTASTDNTACSQMTGTVQKFWRAVVFPYWVSPDCGSRAPSILFLCGMKTSILCLSQLTLWRAVACCQSLEVERNNDGQDKSHGIVCSVWMIQIRCGFLTGRQWQGDLGYTRCWNDSIFGDFETGE